VKLTPAQKRMLVRAYGSQNNGLYGAAQFRCARNLAAKGLIRVIVDAFTFTDEGEKVAGALWQVGADKIED